MYRNIKISNKKYKNKNIIISPVKSYDEYEDIGNWNEYYPFLKIIYNTKEIPSDAYHYVIRKNKIIIGYFISSIYIDNNGYRKMILHDLGIYSRSYAKDGKELINYLLKLARNCYCKELEIKKVPNFDSFYKFLFRHYKVKENNNLLSIVINNPKMLSSESNLRIFKDDKITIENLYFLYGLKFKIYRHKCIFKKNDYEIIINRNSNTLTLPKNIISNIKELDLNNNTRVLIILLCSFYDNNCFNDIYYIYNKKDNNYKTYSDNEYYILDNSNKIEYNYPLLTKIYLKGFNNINICNLSFNHHALSYHFDNRPLDIRNHLKRNIKYLDLNHNSLKEVPSLLKETDDFNNNLINLKRLDFRLGNSFSGIKKFTIIFDEKIKIMHNSEKKDIVVNKEEIIKELKTLSLNHWKTRYESNNPNTDNAWSLSLIFNDNTLEFSGIDSYPNVWIFLLEFIEKYTSFNFRESIE